VKAVKFIVPEKSSLYKNKYKDLLRPGATICQMGNRFCPGQVGLPARVSRILRKSSLKTAKNQWIAKSFLRNLLETRVFCDNTLESLSMFFSGRATS